MPVFSEPSASSVVFGPVPSRRLGRSLGVNNVPPKSCTYSCVYCQVGRAPETQAAPRAFRAPEEVVGAVARRVQQLRDRGEVVDFLTFVPDGEPTLDRHLGEWIDRLRPLGVPIAVITNGSLTWREEVRAVLRKADWVSCKVDATQEELWRRINRPHASLRPRTVLDGIRAFKETFEGRFVSETMLVRDLNDDEETVASIAGFLASVGPDRAYLSVPTRPPAEPWVRPPREAAVNRAFQIFAEVLPRVELLTGFEGTAFGGAGDAAGDLLSTTAVHPLREDAALALLGRDGSDRSVLDRLVQERRLQPVQYGGHTFYMRRLGAKGGSS